ncbi:uncharacterized protein EDB91DRAFT_1047464 [Suillus paluster]|uniref:uncharacterized protein n=1 Tax=Suillus paluster TaxID=48578 RepID=UPI001B866F45|nr:uncharacterized protein EDB91DRAFT_1047464 [Suillus paluster]KAG1748833.1 hypothetical protein EDB91DRAFT_1047464 [Suillus paluster]
MTHAALPARHERRKDLEAVKDARGVAFLDMNEDGTLDTVAKRTGEWTQQGTVSFVQNNLYYGAFFWNAMLLNGACNNERCSTESKGSTYSMNVSLISLVTSLA